MRFWSLLIVTSIFTLLLGTSNGAQSLITQDSSKPELLTPIINSQPERTDGLIPINSSGDGATLVLSGLLTREKFVLESLHINASRLGGRSSDPDQFRVILIDIGGQERDTITTWSPLVQVEWDINNERESTRILDKRQVDIPVPVNLYVRSIRLAGPDGQNMARIEVGEAIQKFCSTASNNPACNARIEGDVNGDSEVNCADIVVVKNAFGKRASQPGFDLRADVNHDDVIDIKDLSRITRALPVGTRCPCDPNFILTDSPIAYYPLNEAPGATTATDLSGNTNNGTFSPTGITLGVPGRGNGDTAALFSNGRIVVSNSAILNPSNITLEALINWSGDNGFQQRIIEKSRFIGGEESQYGLSILPDGKVMVEIQVDAVGSFFVTTSAINSGQLHHLAATYDGSLMRIYLDGVLDSEQAPTLIGGLPANSTNLSIGNQIDRDRPFNGIIDEVALYHKALSPERIKAHAVGFVCPQ